MGVWLNRGLTVVSVVLHSQPVYQFAFLNSFHCYQFCLPFKGKQKKYQNHKSHHFISALFSNTCLYLHLRYTMRNFVNRYTHRSHNVPDKRLSALW